MENIIADIERLSGNLIKERDALQAMVNELQQRQQQLMSDLEQKEKAILELEEQNQTLKIAKSLTGAEDKSEAKLKINELVREIDKCIALLNT